MNYNENYKLKKYEFKLANTNDQIKKILYKKKINNYKKMIIKKGGDITIDDLLRKELNPDILPYFELFKDGVLNNNFATTDDEICTFSIDGYQILTTGANGVTAKIKCNNTNKSYIIKLMYENEMLIHDGPEPADYKNGNIGRRLWENIHIEYRNATRFDNEHIMKTYNCFVFYPLQSEFVFENSIKGDKYRRINTSLDPKYKIHGIVPYFSGLVCEYIEHMFEDINKLKDEMYFNTILQYMIGLSVINNEGYIHTDIKRNNLMLNIIDGVPQCKIIDFGELFKFGGVGDIKTFTMSSPYYSPALSARELTRLTTGINDAISVEDRRSRIQQIKTISQTYDLYMLAKAYLSMDEYESIDMATLTSLFEYRITTPENNDVYMFLIGCKELHYTLWDAIRYYKQLLLDKYGRFFSWTGDEVTKI